MNVLDAINSRYSVRAFKQEEVNKETLMQIFEAATKAPSWADTQPWEIYVAGGEALNRLRREYLVHYKKGTPSVLDLPRPLDWPAAPKQRMMENMDQRFTAMGIDRDDKQAREVNVRRNYEFYGAPHVVYLCLDITLTPWSYFDLGALSQTIMLAAQEFGVASIPAVSLVAYPELIRQELEIPENLMILIGIALGYEDPENIVNKPRSLRRSLEEVVRTKEI